MSDAGRLSVVIPTLNAASRLPGTLRALRRPAAAGLLREVVVVDGYYGVRITEIGTPEERSQTLLSNNQN
ncbi:MAG: hypothetical protein HC846_00005 [Blastocatellia bacterium]|nr:hypothetical protein [Blastocatellia bacterium]